VRSCSGHTRPASTCRAPAPKCLGPVIVSLFSGGSLALVAALSVVNVVLVAVGLTLALRQGVRI